MMSSYTDLTESLQEALGHELDANIRLLTDSDRMKWIAVLGERHVNPFAKLYHRAKMTRDPHLAEWCDTQLQLRVSVGGRRVTDLIETMKVRVEQLTLGSQSIGQPPPDDKKPRRLGFR
jgi:hypothetical protein